MAAARKAKAKRKPTTSESGPPIGVAIEEKPQPEPAPPPTVSAATALSNKTKKVRLEVPVLEPFELNMNGQAVPVGQANTKIGGSLVTKHLAGRTLNIKQRMGLYHIQRSLQELGADGGALVGSAQSRGRREVVSSVDAVLWLLEKVSEKASNGAACGGKDTQAGKN